jgi:hypothetical protein
VKYQECGLAENIEERRAERPSAAKAKPIHVHHICHQSTPPIIIKKHNEYQLIK